MANTPWANRMEEKPLGFPTLHDLVTIVRLLSKLRIKWDDCNINILESFKRLISFSFLL